MHRSIVAIKCLNKQKQVLYGSGVLISQNLVLTTAGNIYNHTQKQDNDSFQVYIGIGGVVKETVEVDSWRYLKEYTVPKDYHSAEFDYALLKLKTSVHIDQFLPLITPCQLCLKEKQKKTFLQVYGFPNYRQNFQFFEGERILKQYGIRNFIEVIGIYRQQIIQYGLSTLPGQEGSPVCTNGGIIAIHLGGQLEAEKNFGLLITINLLININKWMQQLKGNHFRMQSFVCIHSLLQEKKEFNQQLKKRKEEFIALDKLTSAIIVEKRQLKAKILRLEQLCSTIFTEQPQPTLHNIGQIIVKGREQFNQIKKSWNVSQIQIQSRSEQPSIQGEYDLHAMNMP